MNIFALDENPLQAARWHCDAHVVKMTLESTQLLSTAHHLTGGTGPYRKNHETHPCTKWVVQSLDNYLWLVTLALELCREYTTRYHRVHACEALCEELRANLPTIPHRGLTPFAQAMPEEHRGEDPVAAYRRYYLTKKGGRLGTWKTNPPPWWV